MTGVTFAKVFETVFASWPANVDTSAKLALGTASFKIGGLWEVYEEADDKSESMLQSEHEVQLARIINWALLNAVHEIGKTEDLVAPREVSKERLLFQLRQIALEPTMQPEAGDIVAYVERLAQANTGAVRWESSEK